MKNARIIGVAALVLAVLFAVVGVFSMTTVPGEGALGSVLSEAQLVQAQVDGNAKAVRTITSANKKADNAAKAAQTAVEEAEAAVAAVAELNTLVGSMTTGEGNLDRLMDASTRTDEEVTAANAAIDAFEDTVSGVLGANTSAGKALAEVKAAINDLSATAGDVQSVADSMVLDLFAEAVTPAQEAVIKAEENINTALEGAACIYAAMGDETAVPAAVAVTEAEVFGTVEAAEAAAQAYAARAAELIELADGAVAATDAAAEAARTAQASTKLTMMQSIVLTLKANTIALLFTAGLLAVVAVVMLFFAKPFFNTWKKNAVFPVFVVLLGMLVFQTYALGFDQPTFGEWLTFWFNNNFNVLRANTSVGIIALGMTRVIITGGIDLAVGSTLAGVGTVMMVLMDPSSSGIL